MLNVLALIGVAGVAFIIGMAFNAPIISDEKMHDDRDVLEDAELRGFTFNPDPMVSDKLTDGVLLRYLEYLRITVESRGALELRDLMKSFRHQERQMHYLYRGITELLYRMKLDRTGYPYSILQRGFEAYADKRLDICRTIRAYIDTNDAEQKKEYELVLRDLEFDNQNLLKPLENFFVSLDEYLILIRKNGGFGITNDYNMLNEPETQSKMIQSLIKDYEADIRIMLLYKNDPTILKKYLDKWRRVYGVSKKSDEKTTIQARVPTMSSSRKDYLDEDIVR